MLEGGLVFLSTRGLWCVLGSKYVVLDKLRSGMNYNVVAHELSVNESLIQYIQEKEAKMCWSVREATPESAKLTSTVCSEAKEKMESHKICGFMRWKLIFLKSTLDGIFVSLKAKESHG